MARHQFNTVATAGMKILNALEAAQKSERDAALRATRRCAKASASCCACSRRSRRTSAHQLWRDLGYGDDILDAPWPEHDPAALIQDEIELVVQVNGKKRGDVRVPREAGTQRDRSARARRRERAEVRRAGRR